ncbi:hypothetical protein EDD85DRAFT_780463 [Armillaria nabsnona]|nr:hypothetical protein EDD85DRAFT_780463 [Armillaria nabsnona]
MRTGSHIDVNNVHLDDLFPSLEEAEAAVYAHEEKLGHSWRKNQLKTKDGVVKKRTWRCNHCEEPQATHSVAIDPADHRRGRTWRTDCKAHVNANRQAGTGLWRITHIDWTHNHVPEFAPNTSVIRRPSTAMQKAVSQLAITAPKLTHSQIGKDGTVTALWWQSPSQYGLTLRYSDVVLYDNMYNQNDTDYPLGIAIGIDGFGSLRNLWYVLHAREDKETFMWILRNHLESATQPPKIFASDRDGALISAVAAVLPLSFHIYCLHHLDGNITTKLRSSLGDEFLNFTRDFWATYRAVSPEDFDRQYLHEEIYPCREHWAWAWIGTHFTAGVWTTGCVEVENWVSKEFGGPKTSLYELFLKLIKRSQGQDKKEATQSHRCQLDRPIETIFPGIISLACKHLGPFALNTVYAQMELSMFYKTEVLQLPHGVTSWVCCCCNL